MIEPYNAVGLIPTFYGIRRRDDIKHNIEHLKSLTKAAFWLSNLDIPVRLLAIPEGALMGFNDEVLDVDHADWPNRRGGDGWGAAQITVGVPDMTLTCTSIPR